MQAPERMIQRTRLPQSAVKRIVHHQPSSAKEPHGDDDDEEDQEDDDPVDPETYDDAEFYGTLLREFLDNSNVDGQTLSILQSRTKKRKQACIYCSRGCVLVCVCGDAWGCAVMVTVPAHTFLHTLADHHPFYWMRLTGGSQGK